LTNKTNGVLTPKEINALLTGVDMSSEKSVVVTTYGHDDVIDKIAISLFDNSTGYGYNRGNANAQNYCHTLNTLKLSENSWVFARIVQENTPFSLNILLPDNFSKIILSLEDRALQKVFREIGFGELAKALKRCDAAVMEKVFKNVSSRAAQTLKEDMEYLGPIRQRDVEESQERILIKIKHLENTGEIVINRAFCNEVSRTEKEKTI